MNCQFTPLVKLHGTSSCLYSPYAWQSLFQTHFPFCSLPISTVARKTSPESQLTPRQVNPSCKSPLSYYASLLQSCIFGEALRPGKQLHAHLCQIGLGYKPVLATKIVHLYSISNCLRDAHTLFEKIPKRNLFLWNVLIRGYAWHGPYEVAISLYYRLIDCGLRPDTFTFPFVLKASSAVSAIGEGRDIHKHVVQCGFQSDVFVAAALIDMYAKCGCVLEAQQVFDKIVERDAVLWNSMLAAYSQNGHPKKSLDLCRDMVAAGVGATEATLAVVISSSAAIASLPHGMEIHGFSLRHGFQSNNKVTTSLVDMYAKCGYLKVAHNLFEQLEEKRVISWNSMINGYAMHGHATEAIELFEKMKKEAQPDHVTFVGVLSACSRGGLLEEGQEYFKSLESDYHIHPTIQHYTCMVDLLGHCNKLDEAYDIIIQMKVMPDSGVWGALLNSCKIHRNLELGELALEKLIELEPDDAGNYVILSNIYAQAGNWDRAEKMRKLMLDRGIKKSIGCSWIEVRNKVHKFLSGDTSHFNSDAIYAELKRVEGLAIEAGYVPSTGSVFHDVEEDEKANIVRSHSERLAIAFGLISTLPTTRLLITKNLRICEDCHSLVKFISKTAGREIIIRDVNRYHHFKDGICACYDYW